MLEVVQEEKKSSARLVVIGVGGAGNNAINRIVDEHIGGIELIAANTDAQDLQRCKAPTLIQIGEKLTKGLGAGGQPEVGEKAAEESIEDISAAVKGADMVFVTCGMGGGTGTGAAPVIAKMAKEQGILTVGVVTKPFELEGKAKMKKAKEGIEKLKQNVDTLLVVPNQKLFEVVEKKTSMSDGYKLADKVLQQSITGITDIINMPGDMNLDFADIRSVMKDKGVGHVAIGTADGDDKAVNAIEQAINSPLLETPMDGATDIVVNMVGKCIGMDDYAIAMSYVEDIIGEDANIKIGYRNDPDYQDDSITVTVIATGLVDNQAGAGQPQAPNPGFNSRPQNFANYGTSRPAGNPYSNMSSNPFARNTATQATAPLNAPAQNPEPETFKSAPSPQIPNPTVHENNISVPPFLKNFPKN